MESSIEQPGVASYGHRCPKCGSTETAAIGTRGAKSRAVLGGGLLQDVGLVEGSDGRLRYRCRECRHAFVPESTPPPPGELSSPCAIVCHRDKDFAGALMPFVVYLNDVMIGNVANGQAIRFETTTPVNTLAVTDHNGVAFKRGQYRFEAAAGGAVTLHFKRGRFTAVDGV